MVTEANLAYPGLCTAGADIVAICEGYATGAIPEEECRA